MALAAMAFDLRPLVFRSGSMAPTIETGDLAVAQEVTASELAVGDVVSVRTASGSRVTHRIMTVTQRDGRAVLALKGDANSATDAVPYDVGTADRVLFSVPNGGFVIAWLAGPAGLFLLGGYAVWLVMRVARPSPRPAEAGRASAPALAAVAILGVVIGVGAQANAPWTLAAWTDAVGVSGTKLTAYTVVKPAITGCTVTGPALGQKTATIVWTEVSTPHALDYVASIVETGQTMTVTDNGSTRQTQFSAGLLGTVLNQTYNVRITARLPAPNGTWVSVNSNQPVTVGTLGLSLSCGTAS
jgi:signal peptidase I